MLEILTGNVIQILNKRKGITEVLLNIDHPVKRAVNYDRITGSVKVGDKLYLNTTAATLSLGTGGVHFVIANTTRIHYMTSGGHGMKVRYTPFQVRIPFAEEELINKREIYQEPLSLNKKVICFCELHSMIPVLCACFHFLSPNNISIGYIMTDHAALPLLFSDNIAILKERNLLSKTITIGNAFGGDYECVNIYTGLQTAAMIENSDVILVSMGPGITGTGSRYGFSGLELGMYLDLAFRHGGQCFIVPRISFRETRLRHFGISHHTLTLLRDIIQCPLPVPLPILEKAKVRILYKKLHDEGILKKHQVSFIDGCWVQKALEYYKLSVTTMGRGIKDDPDFFFGIGAVAYKACKSFICRTGYKA